jgi:hypothetical protein
MTNLVSTNIDAGVLTNGLLDIKPPVEIFDWARFFIQCGVGVLLLALAFLVWWLLRKKKSQIRIPSISPFAKAIQRLRQARQHLATPGIFCTEVSDAVRAYVEEELGIPALDRTTEEFLRETSVHAKIDSGLREALASLLDQADLVKFAKHEPFENELEDLLNKSMQFVEILHSKLVIVAPPKDVVNR